MWRSLVKGAIWLALGARAAALARHELAPTAGYGLAPSADFELAPSSDIDLGPAADIRLGPAADIEPGEELPSGQGVTPQHSHSVLKKLVSPDAAMVIERGDMLEGQLDPGAQAETDKLTEVPTQQPQPEARLQAPPGQVGLCAGRPIYDGPTLGWEDCRARCLGHCRFWSFWHESVQHRCKLTTDCERRERDGHRNVSAYRMALDAAGEDENMEQAAWDNGMTPLDPEPQQAAAPRAAPEANQTTCSQQGSARKFVASPQGGWHNLGKASSYRSCAKTSLSMGYGGLVWNVGSTGRGRCYGISGDVPDVLESDCDDTYCWLFGAASPACEDQNRTDGAAEAELDTFNQVEPQARMESTKVEIAGAEVNDSVEGELQAAIDFKEFETDKAKHNETLGPQKEQGQVKEKPKGALQKVKDFLHIG